MELDLYISLALVSIVRQLAEDGWLRMTVFEKEGRKKCLLSSVRLNFGRKKSGKHRFAAAGVVEVLVQQMYAKIYLQHNKDEKAVG